MRYRTIVADPPWEYGKRGGFSWREGAPSGESEPFLDYPTMTLSEIGALPLATLAENEAHLFVWTTQRYLVWTQAAVAKWGFLYSKLLVWCKPPTGFSLGGAFGNSCEFVVYARRGQPESHGKVPRDWWEWSRAGHSVKPEAFLDTVGDGLPGSLPRAVRAPPTARLGHVGQRGAQPRGDRMSAKQYQRQKASRA